jgi:hypothetical protein
VRAALGGGNEGVGGNGNRHGWRGSRSSLSELWHGDAIYWTEARSEQLFTGIMDKLETRRRRRKVIRLAITFAGAAVTLLISLGLVGFGNDGPFAHLWSRVQTGWWPAT